MRVPPTLSAALVLVAVTAAIYTLSFPGDFHFDDYPLVLENSAVTGARFRYLSFLDQYGARPLTLWTFHVNFRLAGPDPVSFHGVNVLLHLVVVALLWLVTRRWTGPRIAWSAALLFAVHPLQTQAVNYVWSRSVLLMMCFGLLAVLTMPQRPWLGLVCLQLAVWSRMDGVVFAVPLVLLRRRLWPLTAGLSALNVAAFAYSVGRYAPAEIGWRHPAILDYWLAQPAVLVRYLSLMIWPSGQTVDHDLAPLSFVRSGAALIVLAALGAAAWLCRKKWPVPAAGLGWLFLSLTPAALVPNSDLLNESRAYPALAGAAAAAAWFLGRAGRGDFSERGRVVLALGIAVALGWLSVSRNRLWNDDLGLWREAAQVSPGKARPHYNFAVALARQGRLDESETEFKAANRLQPDDDLSYAALGYCAEMRKDWRNAHSYYLQALRINPGNRYASEGAVRTSKGAAEGGELEADAPMDRRGPVEKRR